MRAEFIVGNDLPFSFVAAGDGSEEPSERVGSRGFVKTFFEWIPVVIAAELERVRDTDAVYVHEDEEHVLHVFVVVPEHRPAVYDRVLAAEDHIRTLLPDAALHFHLRAHQGRPHREAVPLSSDPLFVR
jgi:hypothetical protein